MPKQTKDVDVFKDNILKMFGTNSGILVQDIDNIHVEKFPTGSLKLNSRLKGGYVKGKITEFSGEAGSGKTTLCLHGGAQFQKKYPDEHILWVDLEDVYDPVYFETIGIDVHKNFTLVKPETGEQAWDIIIEFCKNVEGGLIVLDSVALLLPESEDEGSTGDAAFALAARLNSKGLRKIMPHLAKHKTTFFVINQFRSKIGGYGDPNVTTGGKGWAYYARTRIKCSELKGEEGISSNHKFKLIKANYGYKDAVVETSIVYGIGIDYYSEVLDLCVEAGIVKKSGSWFSYDETKLGQGAANVTDLLRDNIELTEELIEKLREAVNA